MEGAKSGVARLESSGIDIRMSDALAKINTTDPLILAEQASEENEVCLL